MSEETTYSGKKPILTVNFVGLIAFVVERKDGCVERVYVLLLDPIELLPGLELCRHAPLLVWEDRIVDKDGAKQRRGLRGKEREGYDLSFQWHESGSEKWNSENREVLKRNFGQWDINDLNLELAGVEPDDRRVRLDDQSFGKILGLDRLDSPEARIERRWLPEPGDVRPPKGIAAAFKIEHGRLSGWDLSDPWKLAREGEGNSDLPYIQFFTTIRWEIFGTSVGRGIQLGTPVDREKGPCDKGKAIRFYDQTEVTVSNLCPSTGETAERDRDAAGSDDDGRSFSAFRDILAYYELSNRPVKGCDRKVFYSTGDSATNTRPGSDPCSPLVNDVEQEVE